MSRRGIFITLTSLLLLTSSWSVAQKKTDPKKEDTKKEVPKNVKRSREQESGSRALRKWLDEDVSYIITNEERAAFKALKTDEEREQFIEQFWLRRDPTPDTVDNEFKEEHYARIAYANERFASGIPGWKTDRGRIYIIYGKADEIESHPSGGTIDRPIEEGGGTTSTFPFVWMAKAYTPKLFCPPDEPDPMLKLMSSDPSPFSRARLLRLSPSTVEKLPPT